MSAPPHSGMTAGGFLAAGITLSVFTAVIVAVRLVANLHQAGKLHADDCKDPWDEALVRA